MIFPDLNLLFVHIPKTGGVSIKDFLQKKAAGFPSPFTTVETYTIPENNELLQQNLWTRNVENADTVFNTVHKPLIEYLNEDKNLNQYFKFTVLRCPLDRFISAYRFLCLHQILNGSFDQLCHVIENSKKQSNIKIFFRTQASYLEPHIDKIDQFFVTENLDQAFIFLSEKYNIQYEHLHHNKSDQKHVLDDKTTKFIYKYYEKDFDLYHQAKNNS